MSLTAADIQEIMRLVEESHFDELLLETQGVKLHLRRSGTSTSMVPVAATASAVAPAAPAAAAPKPAPAERAAGDGQDVTSPMLGTFYRSPKPGAPPYVEVGAQVEADTVICIIEVMKLMSSIAAGVRGTVVEVCFDNASPVQYGDLLFRVKPT